jgi:Uma2 family endonuclease
MTAALSPPRSRIMGNVYKHVDNQWDGTDFTAFPGDLRVKISAFNVYFYPDVSVVRGSPTYEDKTEDVLTNPWVLVEDHSPSTRSRDLNVKLPESTSMPSVQEVLYIESEQAAATLHSRNGKEWKTRTYTGMQAVIHFESIPAKLNMRQIYDRMTVEDDNDTPLDDGPPTL